MDIIGTYAIPVIIALAGAAILFSKRDLFEEFLKGGRDGFVTSVKILPSLVMLICATRMFSASGALDIVCELIGTFTRRIGIPDSLIPVILMRPVSGSAATAMVNNLFSTDGPDSFAGRCASILMGSSDTIIYTLAMYFSAAEIRRTRHALPASFIILAFCTLVSVVLTNAFF